MKRIILALLLVLCSTVSFSKSLVDLSLMYVPNSTRSGSIANAYIYIGKPDTDPEIVANQISITARQESGTEVTIPQPIRTNSGGVPIYNGSPVQLYVFGSYSLKIEDSYGSQKYYLPRIDDPITNISGEIYFVDYTVTDQGAATTEGNRSVADIITTVGLSKKATMVFYHSDSGNTTSYTFQTTTTIPKNFTLKLHNGALLVDTASNANLFVYSPENIDALKTQQIADFDQGTGKIYFTVSGTAYPGWWGAVPSDSVEDTPAINDAILSFSNTDRGGTVFVPGNGVRATATYAGEGATYDASGILLRRGIVFKSDGAVIRLLPAATDNLINFVRGSDRVTIDGFFLDGNAVSTKRIINASDIGSTHTYTNNYISQSGATGGYALYMSSTTSSYDNKIVGNAFVGNKSQAIYIVDNIRNSVFSNNQITSGGETPPTLFEMAGSTPTMSIQNIISENHFIANAGVTNVFTCNQEWTELTGNHFATGDTQVYLHDTQDIMVNNNKFQGKYAVGGAGLKIDNCDYVQADSNYFFDDSAPSAPGILVTGTGNSTKVALTNNIIKFCTHGIQIAGTGVHDTMDMSGNTITDCTERGISFEISANTSSIQGNFVALNDKTGIWANGIVSGSVSGNTVIDNNTSNTAGETGILMPGGTGAVFKGANAIGNNLVGAGTDGQIDNMFGILSGATPNIQNGKYFKTVDSSPSITGFTGGYPGKEIWVIGDTNTRTFTNTPGSLILRGATTLTLVPNDTAIFMIKDDGIAYLMSYEDNTP